MIVESRSRRAALLVPGLVLALLLLGAVLRFGNLNWDQSQHVHPDERFVVWVADTMSWPDSLAEALDPARSPLNPFRWPPGDGDLAGTRRSYAYGHLPLYLLLALANAAQALAEWLSETVQTLPSLFQSLPLSGRGLAGYDHLPLVGRTISTVADLGTLLLVFGLGRRIYGVRAGLLGAAAYAFAVLPIQLSHFYSVDSLLTFLIVAGVYLAARWADEGGVATWLGAGALAGLAVGSKFSAVLIFGSLLAAVMYRMRANGARSRLAFVLGRTAIAGGVALLAFALTNPFAILELPTYLSEIMGQRTMVTGVMDAPYTRQYVGTLPYWYFIQQLSQWGLGWPLGIAAWAGLIWATFRAIRGRLTAAEGVLLAWALPYFLLTGSFHAKFLRYMLPLLPFMLVFGAGAALRGLGWLRRRWPRNGALIWQALAGFTALFTVGWALAFTGVYRQEHPWIQASRWIYAHVPEDSTLVSEHWDDALPLLLTNVADQPPMLGYERHELPLYDPDSQAKLEQMAELLGSADYVIVASNRLSGSIPRLPARYPMSSQYHRLLAEGGLGYELVAEFTAYPRLGGVVIPDEHADESFTVYDHPHVSIYANAERLAPSLLHARLGRYLPLGAALGSPTFLGAPPSLAAPWVAASVGHATSVTNPVAGDLPQATLAAPSRPPGHASLLPPGQAPAPDAPLTLLQPVDTLPVVDDFRWNRAASGSPVLAVLVWWIVLSILGWAAWPLLFTILPGLRDRGFGLARQAGWLLLGWLHWLGVSLNAWENRLLPLAVLVAGLIVAGVITGYRQRGVLLAYWRTHRRLLLGEEALFAFAYLTFVGIRLLNPDLWQPWNGGEKFMEFAFLNATLRSAHFPPYDPYFAGGIINYYYYGYHLVGMLIKLTGIVPEVAFNLAIPGFFGLTALGLFSVGYNLAPRIAAARRTGLLAVLLALLLSNLSGMTQLLGGLAERGGDASGSLGAVLRGIVQSVSQGSLPSFDYWAASRVIPYTINEFPLWTFLFADLHPHLIAMPFGLLVVGLALNRLLQEGKSPSWAMGAGIGLLIVALGMLGPTNTWDLPVYFLLVLGAFLLAAWRRRSLRAVGSALLLAVVVGALAVAIYWPFYTHYDAQVGGEAGPWLARFLAPVRGEGSELGPWLQIWGFFLFLAYSFTLAEFGRQAATSLRPMNAAGAQMHLIRGGGIGGDPEPAADLAVPRPRLDWLVLLLAILGFALILFMIGRHSAAVAMVPLALGFILAIRRELPPALSFVVLLLVLGLGIVFGTEIVYLRDFLEGGDWYRMNTLFKFSIPAWLLLGLAGSVLLPHVWAFMGRSLDWLGEVWRVLAVMLLVAGLIFIPLGIPSRVRDRFPGPRPAIGTLDGTAFMTVGRYNWPNSGTSIELIYDYRAIHWLLDNAAGTPVVAEAPAGAYSLDGETVGYDYYRAGGLRVASLTGFPTLVGQHQYEQRPGQQVSVRAGLGQEFFSTEDLARARDLIRNLHIKYIYVGTLERILFPDSSLRKFDVMAGAGELTEVYRNERVTIWEVTETFR